MLTSARKAKLSNAIKSYRKTFLDRNLTELDESGTRIMINTFLTDVLRFQSLDEIKTEYMIKGTYADYVIQTNGVRQFLVEVKALSFQLSEKHLRQTINYGANEGIEWALLTNGKQFDFYKILFNKPIESRKIFLIDLSDSGNLKNHVDNLQYLHKDGIVKKGLKLLWNKCEALDPINICGIIYSKDVVAMIRKIINKKYGERCEENDIYNSLNKVLIEKIDPVNIKPVKFIKAKKEPIVNKINAPKKVILHTVETKTDAFPSTTLN